MRSVWRQDSAAPIPASPPAADLVEVKVEGRKKPLRISATALAAASVGDPRVDAAKRQMLVERAFKWAEPAPGVLPKEELPKLKLAMDNMRLGQDSAFSDLTGYAALGAIFSEGQQFMGYPYLSELTQRAEYRRPVEILAKEMTRKWIKLHYAGSDEKQGNEKLKAVQDELTRLDVRHVFRKAIEHDGFFGRAQIYIDIGIDQKTNQEELKRPLIDGPEKIEQGKPIKRLTLIEPIWTYPNFYNAFDPLDPTFFNPETWFVMGLEVHSTRFLTFVSRAVPDMLKPAYAFGGLSLSQMLKPYVDNWLRTRQSVSDILHAFSVFVLKTNMTDFLNGGAAKDMFDRLDAFTRMRDNRGVFMVDKDTEDFSNVSAPLGSLDHLQAQSQEQMSGVVGAPLSVLFGISPSGLNASSEGEIKTFNNSIGADQEATPTANLSRLINLIQYSLWGEVDPAIEFTWEALWSLDERQKADLRKVDADTDAVLIDRGVIDPEEARQRVADDPESPYGALDLDKEIVPPGQEGGEGESDSHWLNQEPGSEGSESTAGEAG